MIIAAKEEEKKRLAKKSAELLVEKTQLESRAKQLSQNMNVSLKSSTTHEFLTSFNFEN